MSHVSATLERFERRFGLVLPAGLRVAWLEGRVPEGKALFQTEDGKVLGWINAFSPVESTPWSSQVSYVTDYEALSRTGLLPTRLLAIASLSNDDRIVISVGGPDLGHVYYWAWSEQSDSESNSTPRLHRVAPDFDQFLATLTLGFDALKAVFACFNGDFTPPWGLPADEDFARIEARYGTRYPEDFVRFQTREAARLPAFPEGFRWANAGLEPYASLEDLIGASQSIRALDFLPFADDNGLLFGFRDSGAVVSLEHPNASLHEEAPDFVTWLWQQYQQHLQKRVQT